MQLRVSAKRRVSLNIKPYASVLKVFYVNCYLKKLRLLVDF